ncbi:MAG: hypothetical protein AAGG44_15605, partial [Planctomycetota bacterium]
AAEAAVSFGEFLLDQQKHRAALDVFDQGLEMSLEALGKAEGNTSIIRQLWPLYLGLGECLLFDGKVREALEAKQASAQYASDEFRETISMLEAEQLRSFSGDEARSFEDVRAAIPSELLAEEGRINLEFAFLAAASAGGKKAAAEDSQTNQQFAQRTKDCISFLDQARSLGTLDAKDLAWIRSHPFFEHLVDDQALGDWMDQFDEATE